MLPGSIKPLPMRSLEATWSTFRDIFFRPIVDAQDDEGAFACVCRGGPGVTCDTNPPGGIGRLPGYAEQKKVYVTAIHTLVLMLDRAMPRPAKAPVAQAPCYACRAVTRLQPGRRPIPFRAPTASASAPTDA